MAFYFLCVWGIYCFFFAGEISFEIFTCDNFPYFAKDFFSVFFGGKCDFEFDVGVRAAVFYGDFRGNFAGEITEIILDWEGDCYYKVAGIFFFFFDFFVRCYFFFDFFDHCREFCAFCGFDRYSVRCYFRGGDFSASS